MEEMEIVLTENIELNTEIASLHLVILIFIAVLIFALLVIGYLLGRVQVFKNKFIKAQQFLLREQKDKSN